MNITVNEKNYKSVGITFNTLCDLEDMGVSLEDFATKPMSFIRAYVTLCMGGDKAVAGSEMEQHLINGGNFEAITEVIASEVENSDFFRALTKDKEEKAPTSTSKKKSKTTEA